MKLNFKNGRFTILQVSDAQDLHYVRRAMLNMLDAAYDTVRPDLVVLTGDNILGNHLRDARFGTRIIVDTKEGELLNMKLALKHVLKPLEQRGIPFAFIYGNHDDRNAITKEEQAKLYMDYSCCVPYNLTDNSVDCDTYRIPIFGRDGTEAFALWMLDSARYDKTQDKCFEEITPDTVKWFCTQSELSRRADGSPVPSLMFFHIPLPDTKRLMLPCESGDNGAVRSYEDGLYYKLNPALARGEIAEYPSVLTSDSGLFDAIKSEGGVLAVVSGHDHPNCFTARLDGVDFVQTSCASFRCYGNKTRGVRVFTLHEDKPNSYETHFLTYFDLCGKGIKSKTRYLLDAD